jgi:hypothetical protein
MKIAVGQKRIFGGTDVATETELESRWFNPLEL